MHTEMKHVLRMYIRHASRLRPFSASHRVYSVRSLAHLMHELCCEFRLIVFWFMLNMTEYTANALPQL